MSQTFMYIFRCLQGWWGCVCVWQVPESVVACSNNGGARYYSSSCLIFQWRWHV